MRVLAVALLAALAAASEDAPAFNKEELEKILKAEHSQKVSNVFDAQNNIQCVPAPNLVHEIFQRRSLLTTLCATVAGTRGISRIRSCAPVSTACAPRMSSRGPNW